MTVSAAALAIGLVYLDIVLHPFVNQWNNPLAALEPVAARSILATLADGFASMAGIVFSITIVALQLASSQFGPHVLRSFLGDRGSQVSLGTFVGTFVYSLLVIGTVRDKPDFVPLTATYFGILLGLAAIGVLVYFINHIANLIRVDSVIGALKRQFDQATATLFPQQLGAGESVERQTPPPLPADFARASAAVPATASGYVRRIDDAALMRLALRHDLLVRLDTRPGDFVIAGAILMAVAPAARLDARVTEELADCIGLGQRRTPYQDIEFALQQLVEVAVRALSPGINAPYTATPAIAWIGEGLCRIAERRMPSLCRSDEDGRERVFVVRPLTLAALARDALGPIASAAHSQAVVTARLLEVAEAVAARARAEEDRAEIAQFIDEVRRESVALLPAERERYRVREAASGGA